MLTHSSHVTTVCELRLPHSVRTSAATGLSRHRNAHLLTRTQRAHHRVVLCSCSADASEKSVMLGPCTACSARQRGKAGPVQATLHISPLWQHSGPWAALLAGAVLSAQASASYIRSPAHRTHGMHSLQKTPTTASFAEVAVRRHTAAAWHSGLGPSWSWAGGSSTRLVLGRAFKQPCRACGVCICREDYLWEIL